MIGMPPTGKINFSALGTERVDLLRCDTCRRGLDTSLTSGKMCEYCGGCQWNTAIGHLTLLEQVRLYRYTGYWFTTKNHSKLRRWIGIRLLPDRIYKPGPSEFSLRKPGAGGARATKTAHPAQKYTEKEL